MIEELIKNYPNDQDLGKAIRDYMRKKKEEYKIPRSKTIKSSIEVISEPSMKAQVKLVITEQISPEFLQGLMANPLDKEYMFDMFVTEIEHLRSAE